MTDRPFPWIRAVSLALFAFALVAVLWSQRGVGVARDEAVYMSYGSRYADWWSDFASMKDGAASRERITGAFGGAAATAGNREHPPLMKTLFGLSHRVLHRQLEVVPEQMAYRLPTAVAMAMLVVLVYLFGRRHFGAVAGVVGAALVLFHPRLFFHAQLASFDAPVVTLWFATVFAYERALRTGGFPWLLGVIFGLALATKHNALMIPGVIGLHYLWLVYRDTRRGAGLGQRLLAYGRGVWNLKPSVVPALVVVGPLVLIASWPWLWFDTFDHLVDWISFHLSHVHYNHEYLGENLNAPPFPWHTALVTVIATVPVVTLAGAAMGAGALWLRYRRDDSRGVAAEDRSDDPEDTFTAPGALLIVSAAVAIAPFFLPGTPVFGTDKHFLAVVPSLALLAGVAVDASARLLPRALSKPRLAQLCATALAALVIGASLAETRAAHPYALSHYSSLVGGPAGGADLGMNRQIWGYAARGVLPVLEGEAAEIDARGQVPVYAHDASPAWPWYHRFGLLDPRLVDAGREGAGIRRSKLAIVVHEKHFLRHDLMIWLDYGTLQPVYVLDLFGVPLVSVYRRPER